MIHAVPAPGQYPLPLPGGKPGGGDGTLPETTTRVAIVGSRLKYMADPAEVSRRVREYVVALPRGSTIIVSGGEPTGVDRFAWEAAVMFEFAYEVRNADWERHGRAAGMIRNRGLVTLADRGGAFWDGTSPGTRNTIDLFKRAGKPVEVYLIRGRTA